MILTEMMLEVVIGVLVMEVDKVADEVTGMKVVWVSPVAMFYFLSRLSRTRVSPV